MKQNACLSVEPCVWLYTIFSLYLLFSASALAQTLCAGGNYTIVAPNFQNLSNKTYSLDPGGLTSNTPSFVISPTVSTNYSVFVTGTNTANVVVTTGSIVMIQVFPQPLVAPTFTQYACGTFTNGFNLNLTFFPPLPVPNYTIIWGNNVIGQPNIPSGITTPQQFATTGAIASGYYGAYITANGGCSVTSIFTVTPIPSSPLLSVTETKSTTCSELHFTLTANGAQSYSWSTGSALSAINGTTNTQANYYFIGSTNGQCIGTKFHSVYYLPEQIYILPEPFTSLTCKGDSKTLTVLGSNTFTWNTGQTTSIVVTPSVSTIYSLNAISPLGCPLTTSFSLMVYDCVSLSEQRDGTKSMVLFTISPNPVTDILNIKADFLKTHAEKISIVNTFGQTVHENTETTEEINVSNLPPGVYYLTLKTERGFGRQKFIKE